MIELDASRWKPWSDVEIDRLKTLFDGGKFDYQIASEMNKSVESVLAKRTGLGLSRRKMPDTKWTREEDVLLKQYVDSKIPFWNIAKQMKKSKRQVQYRASQLDFATATHLCRVMKDEFRTRCGNNPLAHIIVKRFHASKSRAKARNIEFAITKDFLVSLYKKQNGRCYYSGMEMLITVQNRSRNNSDPYSLSVERLDSTKGYTEDNVVLCCSVINIMKNGLSEKEFILLCQKITTTHSVFHSKDQG